MAPLLFAPPTPVRPAATRPAAMRPARRRSHRNPDRRRSWGGPLAGERPRRRVVAAPLLPFSPRASSDDASSSAAAASTPTPPAAPSEVDPSAVPLPAVGDVVLFPGRWPGEDAAGIVEAIQPNGRGSHTIDVAEMGRLGPTLFAVPRSASSRKGRLWMDASAARVARSAEYIASQDAYQLPGARDGYAPVRRGLGDGAAEWAEYEALRMSLMRAAAATGAVGAVGVGVAFGAPVGGAFGLGATAGVAYLALLGESVNRLGGVGRGSGAAGDEGGGKVGSGPPAALVGLLLNMRFLMPALPLLALSAVASSSSGVGWDGTSATAASVSLPLFGGAAAPPRAQVLAALAGFLTYKAPLVWRTGGELLTAAAYDDGRPDTSLSMTGRLVKAVARGVLRSTSAGAAAASTTRDTSADGAAPTMTAAGGEGGDGKEGKGGGGGGVLVFAGPSGVGKSTLIRRLLDDYPDRFALSVSHTTRAPRSGEEDGIAYHFVTDAEFVELIEAGAFLEHAAVHGNRYGTSVAAVAAVASSSSAGGGHSGSGSSSPRVCILDVDVQGVAAVRSAAGPRLGAGGDTGVPLVVVWVAPPSLEALEARLRGRGTEDEASVRRRLDAAVREMRWAATNAVWDVTLVAGEPDVAYAELLDALRGPFL
ncbi:hypothetical protein MMPV_002519 [Pyropia vietnamensis]